MGPLADLESSVATCSSAIIAFSGGVDSSLVASASHRVLGARALAVTAVSPALATGELDGARSVARSIGIAHEVILTDELQREGYRRNAADRCYFCKTELFESIAGRMRELAPDSWRVLYGAIADDGDDHRPGAAAAREHAVLAPLRAFSKTEVRRYSRDHGLPTADKPSFACLSSRVPYGTPIDAALLVRLEHAEGVLRGLGYRQFRVRHHDTVARVELAASELQRALVDRHAIVAGIQAAGYTYVALDLVGYRSGSMNEVLKAER